MQMKTTDQHKVLHILQETITTEPVAWQVIVEAVKKQITIKNWLDVRGVLQYMLDQKMIARVNSVTFEEYYKL
jgi:Fe2+ or Zn2+ uptake regulation protein